MQSVKLSKKVFIYNICTFCAFYVTTAITLVVGKILTMQETLKLFTTFSFLCAALYFTVLPIAMYKRILNKLTLYVNNAYSYNDVSASCKRYELLSIAFPILSAIVFPAAMTFESGVASLAPHKATSVVLMCIANLFNIALFFYIIYMQTFEKDIHFIPLSKEYTSMSLVVRSLLVSFFSFTAVTFIFVSVLLQPIPESMSLIQIVLTAILPIEIFSVTFGLTDVYMQNKGTTVRIEAIKEFSGDLASGNYSRNKVKVQSRDEFGLFVNDLNVFYDTIKKLLVSLQNNTTTSDAVAAELSDRMKKTADSVELIARNVNTVFQQITHQSTSVTAVENTLQDMIGEIDNLNNCIEDQVSLFTESSAAIEEMVANIQSVTDIVKKNQTAITDLNTAADSGQQSVAETVKNVQSITAESEGLLEASRVIQSIANQTNLLAMNASIEAAHAGEYGAGFSVVADEIRKLAEDSSVQGKRITSVIQQLIVSINDIATRAVDVQKGFDAIYSLSNTVADQDLVVLNAMNEQSAGSSQVLTSIKHIQDVTATVKNGSVKISDGSGIVSSEMKKLVEETSGISASMNDISSETNAIGTSVEKVNTAVQKNADSIKNLVDEMQKFQL